MYTQVSDARMHDSIMVIFCARYYMLLCRYQLRFVAYYTKKLQVIAIWLNEGLIYQLRQGRIEPPLAARYALGCELATFCIQQLCHVREVFSKVCNY